MDTFPRILLVSPTLSTRSQAGSLSAIANVEPPLGLGYLAAVLEEEGFSVRIREAIGEGLDEERLVEAIGREKPDLVGITATILTVSLARSIAARAQELLPDTLFIIGGPQVSAAPEKTMEGSVFAAGIVGEGEYTLREIARALREGKLSWEGIEGVVYRENGVFKSTAPRPYIQDLDQLPRPARHLYPPLSAYRPVPASYRRLPLGVMTTSRGCPHQCTFCDRRVFGNRFRAHSSAYVGEEAEELVERYGAREIRFMDDTFTLDRRRTEGICQELRERNLKVTWTCLTRVDAVDPELLKTMRRAGCWQVIYGLESGEPKILARVKKHAGLEQAAQAVRWTREAKMEASATFILGLPGETSETIQRTIDFALRLRLDVANFFALVVFPGNELYEIARREGKILHEDYDQYTSLIDTQHTRLHYLPEGMTEGELKQGVARAYRSFYLRPSYVSRRLFTIRNWQDLKRYVAAARAILALKS